MVGKSGGISNFGGTPNEPQRKSLELVEKKSFFFGKQVRLEVRDSFGANKLFDIAVKIPKTGDKPLASNRWTALKVDDKTVYVDTKKLANRLLKLPKNSVPSELKKSTFEHKLKSNQAYSNVEKGKENLDQPGRYLIRPSSEPNASTLVIKQKNGQSANFRIGVTSEGYTIAGRDRYHTDVASLVQHAKAQLIDKKLLDPNTELTTLVGGSKEKTEKDIRRHTNWKRKATLASAKESLKGKGIGDFVIRPSSSEKGFYTVDVKLSPTNIQHKRFEILENGLLKTESSKEYQDIQSLVAAIYQRK